MVSSILPINERKNSTLLLGGIQIFTGKKEHGETLAQAMTMTAKKSSSSRQQFLCPRLPLLTPPHPYLVLLSVHQRPELETQL